MFIWEKTPAPCIVLLALIIQYGRMSFTVKQQKQTWLHLEK